MVPAMDTLILSLLGWINLNTEYDLRVDQPNIVMTEKANLCKQYGIDNRSTCEATNLKAFYNRGVTIYLHEDFNPSDTQDQARLLHELVHYIQWHNDKNVGACWGNLESEAYNLQDDWREENSLHRHTDPFRLLMMEAACEDA